MNGFTRVLYDHGYKYTMHYPPGWTAGDKRQPEVYRESCASGPPDVPMSPERLLFARPPPEAVQLPPRRPRGTATAAGNGARRSAGTQASHGAQAAQPPQWSHSLKAYLAQTWMPQYVLGSQVDMSVRDEWPSLPALARPSRTRKLYAIERIDEQDLRNAVLAWKHSLCDIQLTSDLAEQGQLADLALPDTSYCSLDETDEQFLEDCSLGFVTDVTRLLNAYPLRTILKTFKLFLGIPEEHEVSTLLQFRDVNHLCPVRDVGLFDLIALPGCGEGDLSLLMVVVPPWDIRFDDLEEFIRVGVPDKVLDLEDHAQPSPNDVLWAVIWDICTEHNCRFFVLTNYDDWVFGTFSLDMRRARVTTYLPAPVFPKEMSVCASDVADPRLPVPNVLECLLLWMVAATDSDHSALPLPRNMAADGL